MINPLLPSNAIDVKTKNALSWSLVYTIQQRIKFVVMPFKEKALASMPYKVQVTRPDHDKVLTPPKGEQNRVEWYIPFTTTKD